MNTILSLGFIFLVGLFAAKLINKIHFPAITAYLLIGIVIGPFCLNFITKEILASSGLISNMVLAFIAFALGQNFTIERLRKIGKQIFAISIGEVLGAWILVTLCVWLLAKQPFYVALIFGAIAPATAPAAVVMVTREYRAKGNFTDTLLGVIAIDDAWGIILFALCLAFAKAFATVAPAGSNSLMVLLPFVLESGKEIIGSLVLGSFVAFVLSYLSRFLRTQAEVLTFTVGFILLTAGLSLLFGFSLLLACMALGAVVVNTNRANLQFFEALKNIDSPFYLLFFVMVGANLEINLLSSLGLLSIVYVFARLPGEMIGAFIGARASGAGKRIEKYLGLGLAPQAGVALGLALTAKVAFPGAGDTILTTIIITTIIYELIGPICTKYALIKAGDITIETN
jgi:Kef-type K+ transport system membrane component KefB